MSAEKSKIQNCTFLSDEQLLSLSKSTDVFKEDTIKELYSGIKNLWGSHDYFVQCSKCKMGIYAVLFKYHPEKCGGPPELPKISKRKGKRKEIEKKNEEIDLTEETNEQINSVCNGPSDESANQKQVKTTKKKPGRKRRKSKRSVVAKKSSDKSDEQKQCLKVGETCGKALTESEQFSQCNEEVCDKSDDLGAVPCSTPQSEENDVAHSDSSNPIYDLNPLSDIEEQNQLKENFNQNSYQSAGDSDEFSFIEEKVSNLSGENYNYETNQAAGECDKFSFDTFQKIPNQLEENHSGDINQLSEESNLYCPEISQLFENYTLNLLSEDYELPNQTPMKLPSEKATEHPSETETEHPNETATEFPHKTAMELPNETATKLPSKTATELSNETAMDYSVGRQCSTESESDQASCNIPLILPTKLPNEKVMELPNKMATELPYETALDYSIGRRSSTESESLQASNIHHNPPILPQAHGSTMYSRIKTGNFLQGNYLKDRQSLPPLYPAQGGPISILQVTNLNRFLPRRTFQDANQLSGSLNIQRQLRPKKIERVKRKISVWSDPDVWSLIEHSCEVDLPHTNKLLPRKLQLRGTPKLIKTGKSCEENEAVNVNSPMLIDGAKKMVTV